MRCADAARTDGHDSSAPAALTPRTCAVVAALALTVWADVPAGQETTAQEKVTEWYLFNRPMPPPETLEATFVASHAVVRATIVDARTVLTPGRPGETYPTLRTYYSGRVEEAFKAHDSFAGARPLVIAHDGGEYREGTQVWRAINRTEPALVPGKEYILFLYWRNGEQAFRPYFGTELMVELQQDNAMRLARGATTFELPASTTGLVSELRAISARLIHSR
jgi:hypothetical protein